jgi:hypothetical protein
LVVVVVVVVVMLWNWQLHPLLTDVVKVNSTGIFCLVFPLSFSVSHIHTFMSVGLVWFVGTEGYTERFKTH